MLVSKKILIQNVLAIFSKNLFFFFFVENFELVNYFKKTCWAFIFLFENLVGFSCEDLSKFSKTCLFFENFWTWNLLKILLNFLLKILIFLPKFLNNVGHSWNDLVMSFGNLIKTLLGLLMKILANFLKACLFFENFWT